ncbi:hypothetical protein NBRC10512v2_002664 [Rhodotorula toruloides]
MDAPSLQTHSPQTQDGRIPLSADASILPPAYRSAIANEWAYRYPQYYSEWEDIYWLFDGWDELADRLYVDWAAHLSEVEAVRRAYANWTSGTIECTSGPENFLGGLQALQVSAFFDDVISLVTRS